MPAVNANSLGIWVLGCLGLFALPGCGSDLPARAPVSGAITFNGQAVSAGTVTFYPSTGRAALGKIQPDGSYRLTTFDDGDGAILGEHRVTIEATQVTGTTAPTSFEEEVQRGRSGQPVGAATMTWLVPYEFADRATSPLTAQVQRGENRIDFHLPLADQH
jgi:hypothetical protein